MATSEVSSSKGGVPEGKLGGSHTFTNAENQ